MKDSLSASQSTEGVTGYATLPAQALHQQQLLRVARLRRLSSPRNLHLPFPPLSLLDSAAARAFTLSQTPPLRSAGPPTQDSVGPCASGVLLICRTGRGEVESRHGRTAHQKASLKKPLSPRSLPGAEGIVFVATGSVQAPMQPSAVIVEKIKHKHSQKESNFPLPSLTSALPPCSRPLEFIQPLATRAEAWQAIPGVSDWVMGIIKRGYSLQFARRPPRFSGVVSTSVQARTLAFYAQR